MSKQRRKSVTNEPLVDYLNKKQREDSIPNPISTRNSWSLNNMFEWKLVKIKQDNPALRIK